MITLIRTDSNNVDFQKLVVLLDKDLAIRDGDEHSFYHQFNSIDSLRNVIVCYNDNVPVGCGAFKEYSSVNVEIKRMYVLPDYRGRGIAYAILKGLEIWASETGYTGCILETGKKQPEAISLYQKAGYERMDNYGQYKNVENSVCMKKDI